MQHPHCIDRALPRRRAGVAILLAAAILPVQAETIEAYVKPFVDVSSCEYSHWVFDACTGLRSLVLAHPDVDLEVDPCEPVLLIGNWGRSDEDCWVFLVSDVAPTDPLCTPQPGLRAEEISPSRFEWSWDPVPCVNSYDLVVAYSSTGSPPGMDDFQCAFDNFGDDQGGAVELYDPDPVPGNLTALLVRGQQGALALDHYGLASSGEQRRPPSDCDVDLSEPGSPSPRAARDAVPDLVP